MRFRIVPAFAGLWLILLAVAYAQVQRAEGVDEGEGEGEHEIAFASLPEAVRTAAEAILGGAGEYEVETEVVEGVRWYEIEAEVDGKELELKFTEDGILVEREMEIDFETLPEAARRELKINYPTATFTEVEAVELHFYEVEFSVDGREHEVRVYASGDIEDENDDDDEEEEDEEDDD